MARAAKPTKTVTSRGNGRPLGRPLGSKNKPRAAVTKAPPRGRTAKVPERRALAPKQPTKASARAPIETKNELRVQIEKLVGANAALRAKGRAAAREGKGASARITELEARIAKLEGAATRATPDRKGSEPTGRSDPRATKKRRGRRLSAERDPGDRVPPGVAVQEPEPTDREAEAALQSLGEHLTPAS